VIYYSGKDKYEYSFDINLDERISALIPTHNATDLLAHSFDIMNKAGCLDLISPIVIDDRSTENVETVCAKYGFGYIRIDHDLSFNYSVNMNIGAKILSEAFAETAIFLNNDVYLNDREKLALFIEKHFENDSKLSSPKLIYPPEEYSFKDSQPYANTVQFAGGRFVNNNAAMPDHIGRYLDGNDVRLNVNAPSGWATGAFNLIDLVSFWDCGGYNEQLGNAYQDVLLSLQFHKRGHKVFYIGDGVDFYHDETTTRMEDWKANGADTQMAYLKTLESL
jgi:GT2 family glycosyltransferase